MHIHARDSWNRVFSHRMSLSLSYIYIYIIYVCIPDTLHVWHIYGIMACAYIGASLRGQCRWTVGGRHVSVEGDIPLIALGDSV